MDIYDLDITDFSVDNDENEDFELDDPLSIQQGDAGQWCNRMNEIEINEFISNVRTALVLSEDIKEIEKLN